MNEDNSTGEKTNETNQPHANEYEQEQATGGVIIPRNKIVITNNTTLYSNKICQFPLCQSEAFNSCQQCPLLVCWNHFIDPTPCHISHKNLTNSTVIFVPSDVETNENPGENIPDNNLIPEPNIINHQETNNDKNSPEVVDDVPSEVKKKEKRPNKKLLAKLNRIHGKEYVSVHSKKVVPQRALKERCSGTICAKYSRECEKLSEEWRERIFRDYYSLDSLQKQREYINRYCTKALKKKSTAGPTSARRKFSCYFYLPSENSEKLRVCRQTFLNTLCISEKFYRTAIEKLRPTGIIEGEKRGGRQKSNSKADEEKRKLIEKHIEGFPRFKSQCLKADTAKEYLSANLTVRKMYDMLLYEIKDEHLKPSLAFYTKIFKSKNLCFLSSLKKNGTANSNAKNVKSKKADKNSTTCLPDQPTKSNETQENNIVNIQNTVNDIINTCQLPICQNEVYDLCHQCSVLLCWNHYVDQTPCHVAHKNLNQFNTNIVPSGENASNKNENFNDNQTCKISDCHKKPFFSCNDCSIPLCSDHYRNDISCHISHQNHFLDVGGNENAIPESSRTVAPVTEKTNEKRTNKKLLAKINRVHGKEYVSVHSKKVVPGKALKEKCDGINCAKYGRECQKLSEKWRESIFQAFYSLDTLHQQREYVNRYCLKTLKKRSRVADKIGRRKYSCFFYLPSENFDRLKVCRQTFLNTLCISEKFYRTAVDKLQPTGILEGEKRGGRQKKKATLDEAKRKLIEDHINVFPRIKSSSTQKLNPKEYLPAGLTVKKMYDMLIADVQKEEEKPSLALYRKIFKSKNLSFIPQKKDKEKGKKS